MLWVSFILNLTIIFFLYFMIFQGIFVWENDKDPLHAQPGEQHEIVQGEGL